MIYSLCSTAYCLPKTARGRWIPLTPEAVALYAGSPSAPSGPRAELGRPWPLVYRQVAEPFTRALRRTQIVGACWHCWRHTFASRLVQRGVSLYLVSRLLGHSSLAMSARYAHLAMEDLEQAVRALER